MTYRRWGDWARGQLALWQEGWLPFFFVFCSRATMGEAARVRARARTRKGQWDDKDNRLDSEAVQEVVGCTADGCAGNCAKASGCLQKTAHRPGVAGAGVDGRDGSGGEGAG